MGGQGEEGVTSEVGGQGDFRGEEGVNVSVLVLNSVEFER